MRNELSIIKTKLADISIGSITAITAIKKNAIGSLGKAKYSIFAGSGRFDFEFSTYKEAVNERERIMQAWIDYARGKVAPYLTKEEEYNYPMAHFQTPKKNLTIQEKYAQRIELIRKQEATTFTAMGKKIGVHGNTVGNWVRNKIITAQAMKLIDLAWPEYADAEK